MACENVNIRLIFYWRATQTILAWWRSKEQYQQWKTQKEVANWISGQKARYTGTRKNNIIYFSISGSIGDFHEVAFFPPVNWESLQTGPKNWQHPGISVVAKDENNKNLVTMEEEITHDYIGSMRDRMPISYIVFVVFLLLTVSKYQKPILWIHRWMHWFGTTKEVQEEKRSRLYLPIM